MNLLLPKLILNRVKSDGETRWIDLAKNSTMVKIAFLINLIEKAETVLDRKSERDLLRVQSRLAVIMTLHEQPLLTCSCEWCGNGIPQLYIKKKNIENYKCNNINNLSHKYMKIIKSFCHFNFKSCCIKCYILFIKSLWVL